MVWPYPVFRSTSLAVCRSRRCAAPKTVPLHLNYPRHADRGAGKVARFSNASLSWTRMWAHPRASWTRTGSHDDTIVFFYSRPRAPANAPRTKRLCSIRENAVALMIRWSEKVRTLGSGGSRPPRLDRLVSFVVSRQLCLNLTGQTNPGLTCRELPFLGPDSQTRAKKRSTASPGIESTRSWKWRDRWRGTTSFCMSETHAPSVLQPASVFLTWAPIRKDSPEWAKTDLGSLNCCPSEPMPARASRSKNSMTCNADPDNKSSPAIRPGSRPKQQAALERSARSLRPKCARRILDVGRAAESVMRRIDVRDESASIRRYPPRKDQSRARSGCRMGSRVSSGRRT